jgi:hypothetical protein
MYKQSRHQTHNAQSVTTRNACHFVERHSTVRIESNERVAAFVICRHLLDVVADEAALALGAHHDAVLGPLKVLEVDFLAAFLRCLNRSLAEKSR